MPSKYPVVKPTDIIHVLSQKGFSFVSSRGSHQKYSDGHHTVIIPMHYEVAKGTLKSILTQADITLEEFLQLL